MEKDIEQKQLEETSDILPKLLVVYRAFLANWKWFVLSVAVCLVLGWIHLQRQTRVYQRQAVMLVEDAETSSSGMTTSRRRSSGINTLLDLNGISVGDNLKNEMFILTSCRLMERVVDSLGLDVDYTTTSSLHTVPLYRTRPFEVHFAEHTKDVRQFRVLINGNGSFTLDHFNSDAEHDNSKVVVTLRAGEKKNTPAGTLSIETNASFATFPRGKEITVTHMPRKMAAKVYAGKVSASEYEKETSLIVIICKDLDAERAEDIVNEVFEAYKQDVVDNKNRVAQHTAAFINDRIELIGQDLSEVEGQMATFKRDNQIVDFSQNAALYLTEESTARKQALELETQVAVTKYLSDFLQDKSKSTETIPVLTIGNATFGTLIADYNELVMQRNRLQENSSETSPAVRDLDRQIASLRSSLMGSIASHLKSLELQLARARATEAQISGRMGQVPDKEQQALDIKRQQELKSALYTYLLNKREEVALQMAINEANVRLVEEPMGGSAPISPRSSVIMLIALLIGIAIPAGIIWIIRLFDVTISGRQDVEKETTIPIAGELPHFDCPNAPNGLSLISSTSGDSPIMEAFRVLRYSLFFMRHSAKVFVVTSATPGQGKSFISTNLAYILAVTGKRVLFIDADIRRRTVSLSVGNSRGLTALLADDEGEIHLSDLILKDVISQNVDFLPAGKMPPNPAELLMGDRLDNIIDEARTMYDYIVIDTTPTMGVADASIVDRVADVTVFALRVGLQERSFLPALEQMYQSKKFRQLCVVVNDADAKGTSTYGFGYGYGYRVEKKRGFFRKK